MKKRIKQSWMKALRSGEYKKGKGQLLTSDGKYCCLGVLTRLYCKSKKVRWSKATKENSGTLPREVKVWAGIDNSNPAVKFKTKWSSLAGVNDNTDTTFPEIADIISKQL